MTDPRKDGQVSIERLRELFDYDAETGILTRKRGWKGVADGAPVGTPNANGYLRVGIDYVRYLVHRVVWAVYYGEWPVTILDHINGNRLDNRIQNLRLATKSQNAHNSGKTVRSSSGFKGVYWHERAGKWFSHCQVNKKSHYLGLYETKEEASAAYQAFVQKHLGEFARKE